MSGYSQALERTLAAARATREVWTPDAVARAHAKLDEMGISAESAIKERFALLAEVALLALDYGETYYWEASICRLIEQTQETMPSWTLTLESLPSREGVFWFGQPYPCAKSETLEASYRAFGMGSDDGSGIEGVSWVLLPSQESVALTAYLCYPEGGCRVMPPDIWNIGETSVDTARKQGDDDSIIGYIRRFACMLAFLEQRILVAPQQRVERHARKRLERAGYVHEPLVRVVELRRKQARSEHSDDHEAVEWSHQWIVSGHWRQQWYPSLNANQPRWIMPYVKGPEDKPLKPPRARVFAVVR